jgi:hypothetical protein
MTPRPVAVTWTDHCHISPGGWVGLDELDDVTPCPVVSVGFLLRRDRETLVLAQSVTDDSATGVFVILRSCVKKVKRL